MTGLALTPERRTELAELLGDESRLKAEYPRVAEYLDTAPMLSGTSNAETDAAFDLRFVYYMTGVSRPRGIRAGTSWGLPSEQMGNGGSSMAEARPAASGWASFKRSCRAPYAYAIPSPETLDWVKHAANRGRFSSWARGYWARLLAEVGVRCIRGPLIPSRRTRYRMLRFRGRRVNATLGIQSVVSMSSKQSWDGDSVLLLCRPPGWGDPMASEALELFEARGGRRLIYLGERWLLSENQLHPFPGVTASSGGSRLWLARYSA
ncbi:hypothetical protein IU450_04830 [Nocardia abscessus]|uniref:hypothetical protein n=1 Tax=Nocardia TaxID=1817 RepID=UPI001895323F|nr:MULTISPECIES: hypothetical protein [Nocardia]MBF6335205.1 hypothetical protein [Nocardia abscessus]MDE1671588.1 hypothetical protein [Nocardia gipuzkoensis]